MVCVFYRKIQKVYSNAGNVETYKLLILVWIYFSSISTPSLDQ